MGNSHMCVRVCMFKNLLPVRFHFPVLLAVFGVVVLSLLLFYCIDFRYATDFVRIYYVFQTSTNRFTNSICKSFDAMMSLVCTLHMFIYIYILELKAQNEAGRKKKEAAFA